MLKLKRLVFVLLAITACAGGVSLAADPLEDLTSSALLAAELGVSAARPLRVVQTPVEEVAIRYEWLPHLVEKEGDARERYARYLLPTLIEPFEVWLTRYEDGRYRKRYIGVFQGAHDIMVIVRENADGSLMWNFMQARDQKMNQHRVGALLYRSEKPAGVP